MSKLKRNNKAESKTLYKKMDKKKKQQEEKMMEKAESMLDIVESDLEGLGVIPFSNDNVDEDFLVLPVDITEESSVNLGKYFNAFTQQKMWTRTIIGRLSTTIREMRRSLDEVKADVFASQPAKMPLKEKELKFQVDPRARDILDDMFLYEEKLKMTNDYLENLIDGIVLISREISRRTMDWEHHAREDNISRKRR